ncbi:protocatechuate 3,4-dioxygenase beta subunit [Arthrobacter sp. V4I6]|uniref:dioxygenase family protein n=1 Tax=unclassified Arthrobacter TaxID=235627 RepID=UPI0027873D6F|nr:MULTISPECIES: hypothetical protein [unclassified Arthrobacter]MDQ0821564.1 protocatechuate 3,4-dioxygenase beta subunit [Arthrobacter sp. V1I7]MDQ0855829.1 protocatechuate 3,4-dioxygenase beta subunit [Arthrobacter sp. V4I6]
MTAGPTAGIPPQQQALEEDIVRTVLASFENTSDHRLRILVHSLTPQLHAFIREIGGDIAAGAPGSHCWIEGQVTGTDGRPVPGACIEGWEADEDGFYDVRYADRRVSCRARLNPDGEGGHAFWGLAPSPYPVPHDGAVGRMFDAMGRSPMRPSHRHRCVRQARKGAGTQYRVPAPLVVVARGWQRCGAGVSWLRARMPNRW